MYVTIKTQSSGCPRLSQIPRLLPMLNFLNTKESMAEHNGQHRHENFMSVILRLLSLFLNKSFVNTATLLLTDITKVSRPSY
jgi:hypothetical protein